MSDFLTASQSLSFFAVNESDLSRLNIIQAGMLFLQGKEELCDAVESTRGLGADEMWSNENLTAAMIPSDQRLIVMLDKPVPSARPRESTMETVSGVINYTALVADPRIAVTFFAAEAKASNGIGLMGHIPQALVELVACAKHLGKAHIRGALTTGDKWIFLAVDLDSGGEGATYWESEVVEWRTEDVATDVTIPVTSNRYDPAVISGILSSWVLNSFSEFDGDQWFYKSPLST